MSETEDPRLESYRSAKVRSYKAIGWTVIIFFLSAVIYSLFAGK